MREPPRITIERDRELDTLLDADEELTPEEMLQDSFEVGRLVELRCAGASGTITERGGYGARPAVQPRQVALLGPPIAVGGS